MIKAALFDIGGVLYKGTMEGFLSELKRLLPAEGERLAALDSRHADELLLGRMSFFALADELGVAKETFEAKARQAWTGTFILQEDVVQIIRALRRGLKVGCLSNATDLDVLMDRGTGLDRLFDPYLNSCGIGERKPGRRIFEIALAKLGCRAAECVYIDDKGEYLETPGRMGFAVLRFEDAEQLKKDLARMGIGTA